MYKFIQTISGLQNGVFYFVRVSAANSQGYGATTASAPSSLNPNQQSSFPSNVKLAVTSDTMLTVGFDLPIDNGGDVITGFRVEWDISLTFNSNLVGSPNKVGLL